MNNKEDKPESLEGLSGQPSPAEIISQMVDKLGELLHDHPNKNGNITINYYNSVGQRIDSVTTQNFSSDKWFKPSCYTPVENTQHSAPAQEPAKTITSEQLAQVIEKCQRYFWGNSSYAVLFCLLRDEYHMADNQSQFESMVEMLPYSKQRDYTCQPGTIAAAFTNTPLFKMHVSEWEEKKPMERIMTLLSELRKGITHLK